VKVLLPTTVAEACDLLKKSPGAVPIAGATDVLVHWPLRQPDHDKTYLDLSGIPSLRGLEWRPTVLRLGAMTTYWDVINDARIAAEFPLLIDAARQVGAVQIQSRGTWAGNIANGSPAADGVPVLMAYDAGVELTSTAGTRSVPLNAYYTGYRTSIRRPGELITGISLPRVGYDLQCFHKVGPRRAQAITKVGVAIARRAATGPGRWRVVANSVAPTVRRCPNVEALLESGAPITSPDSFVAAASSDISPIDDIRSTADYRRAVFCRLLYHSLHGRV
jgi:CO/xanthine dehydrogenase FAD-binding subunit